MKNLTVHQEEYRESLSIIKEKIKRGKGGRNHPLKFAEFMWASLKESADQRDFATKRLGKSNRARNAHDFYGWMSKSGKLGECRGAIYRSKRYMEIALTDRSGRKKLKSKGEEYTSHDVHIEHSVPVAVILETIWHESKRLTSNPSKQVNLRKLHETFLSMSVCTALTRHEEKVCVKKKFKKKHPEFDAGKLLARSLEDIHPFARYDFSEGLRIYEVIDGTVIDPENFTLKDHMKLVNAAGIYRL